MNLFQFASLISTSSLLLATAALSAQAATISFETFESGNFSGVDDTTGITSIEDNTFPVTPAEGNFQALLENTGTGNATPGFSAFVSPDLEEFLYGGPSPAYPESDFVEGSAIKRDITVQAGDVLSFSANFLTDEPTGTGNNDVAFLSIDDNAGNESLIRLFEVDNASFNSSATSFSFETGYQLFNNAFTFPNAGTFTVGVGVVDGDGNFAGDSAVLVDAVPTSTAVPFEVEGTMGLAFLGAFIWYRSRKKRKQALSQQSHN